MPIISRADEVEIVVSPITGHLIPIVLQLLCNFGQWLRNKYYIIVIRSTVNGIIKTNYNRIEIKVIFLIFLFHDIFYNSIKTK